MEYQWTLGSTSVRLPIQNTFRAAEDPGLAPSVRHYVSTVADSARHRPEYHIDLWVSVEPWPGDTQAWEPVFQRLYADFPMPRTPVVPSLHPTRFPLAHAVYGEWVQGETAHQCRTCPPQTARYLGAVQALLDTEGECLVALRCQVTLMQGSSVSVSAVQEAAHALLSRHLRKVEMVRSGTTPTFHGWSFAVAPGKQVRVERDGPVWGTPDGDTVMVTVSDRPPDLPNRWDQVGTVITHQAEAAGAAAVELAGYQVDGCPAIYSLLKVPQEDGGMTYLGNVTVPFRDFSYLLSIQCPEKNNLGTRDAVVFDHLLQTGTIQMHNGVAAGWDAGTGRLSRTLADDPVYDANFPAHPLSRARQLVAAIVPSIRLDPRVKQSPVWELT